MTLLLPENGERYQAWTRNLAHLSEKPVEMLLAGLAGRAGDVPEIARQSVLRYLEHLQWPARQMEYSYTLRALSRFATDRPLASILDVGAGPSPFPAILATAYPARVTAIDRDAGIVEAMERLGLPGCAYRISDMCVLPFPDRTFDAVTCVSVLEHVPRQDGVKAIGEMLRVVRPGGLVVLTIDYRALSRWDFIARQPARVRNAIRMLLSHGAAAVALAMSAPQPYDWKDLKDLFVTFHEYTIGGPEAAWARVSLKRIRAFWTGHWQSDFHYNKRKGRDYTSIGVLLSPNPEVRRALQDLRPERT